MQSSEYSFFLLPGAMCLGTNRENGTRRQVNYYLQIIVWQTKANLQILFFSSPIQVPGPFGLRALLGYSTLLYPTTLLYSIYWQCRAGDP